MAVEIPVVIDIEGAFQDAAKRVPQAIEPLQSVIESAPASLFIDVKVGKSKKVLIELFDDAKTTTNQFNMALDQVNAKIEALAARGGFNLRKGNLTAEEKNLLEAASILEMRLKGIGNESSAMARVLTINMKQAEAEITKYNAKLATLQRQQNLTRQKADEGSLSPKLKYQKQIEDINIKLSETKSFIAACGIEMDRLAGKTTKAAASTATLRTAGMEMAESFRRGHAYIERWNASLNTGNSRLMMLVKNSIRLIALHSAVRFVRNIREVTAEFEMQRVALGGIIQDTEMAEDLFKRIKAAAIQSPFEIKDLVSYTKQLSAYRIETDKLFDVTMRLADISAGLGVDMNRLVLAYGQVRAASVLRGQELRQFTEAGIPLVELLADKFEELGRAGTTTADVFELISKRAVPFSMIEDIFNDMTEAGGIFYKMQEKQSETLKGKWMKLKDAASIMYDEIGNTETVHKAMTDLLATLMKLMQNWRQTGRVIGSAVTALVAYKIAMANGRIAAAALTKAEVAEISALELNVVGRSKMIAAIFGETAATKVAITFGNAYVAMKTREMTATNLFTKSLYKMLAALLANPYATATAAIVVLIGALVRLTKKTDEARISQEDFQKTIESYNSSDSRADEIDKLCDKYDKLSAKTNRSVQETEELVRVAKELGKAYPQTIYGTDASTGAIELNTQAIRDNNKEMREAIRLNLIKDKKRAEDSIDNLIEQRDRIISRLQSGQGIKFSPFGKTGIKSFELTEDDRAEMGAQLIDLNKRIEDMQESIEAADKALEGFKGDLIGPVEPDFLGNAWKMQLNSYVATLESSNVTIKALMKDQIEGFGDQYEAMEAVAKEYDAQTKLVDFYTESLKSATGARKEQTEVALKDARAMQAVYWQILQDFNATDMIKDTKKKGSYTQDAFIQTMQDRIKFMQDFKKGYDDLNKYMNKEAAISKQAENMLTRGLSLGIDASQQKRAAEELSAWYSSAIQEAFEKAQKYGAGKDRDAFLARQIIGTSNKDKALRDFQKLIQSLLDAKTDLDTSELKKNLEESFKRMEDEMKRSETVRNFYQNILDMTGDQELATSLSVSVYGGIGEDFENRMQAQLDRALGSLNPSVVTDTLREAFAKRNFEVILQNLQLFPEEWQKVLKEMAADSEKFYASQATDLLKALEKARTFSEKRGDLAKQTALREAQINELKVDEDAKRNLRKRNAQKDAEEAAKLAYEAFKDTPMYVELFANLDAASTRMLKSMRDNLEAVKSQWKNLDPTELKELQSRIQEVDKQLATKNPFAALRDSIKEYRELVQTQSREEADIVAVSANERLNSARQELELRIKQYNAISAATGEESEMAKQADKRVKEQQKIVDEAEEEAKAAQEIANQFRSVASRIQGAAEALNDFNGYLSEALGGVGEIVETLGSADVADTFGILSEGLTKTLGGIANIGTGIGTMLTNPIAGAAKIISGIGGVVGGIFGTTNALKMKRINNEIDTQDDILHNLEKSYNALEKAIANAFDSDYVYNYTEQLKNLEAQQSAYLKQAQLEREKGKKADEEKIKGYEESAEATYEKIMEMQGQLAEHFAGTDVTSAARNFAKSWFDAYREFGNTTAAIREKFKEMIDNMIVESVAGQIMKNILEPIYNAIDTLAEEGFNEQEIASIAEQTEAATAEINTAMAALVQRLAAAGINMRDTAGGFSGIAREFAGASEQDINGLAAGINTQNFYMSYVPTISADVAAIRAAITGTATPTVNPVTGEEPQFGDELFRGQMSRIDANIADLKNMMASVITLPGTRTNSKVIAVQQ